jgi:hypothetical protein
MVINIGDTRYACRSVGHFFMIFKPQYQCLKLRYPLIFDILSVYNADLFKSFLLARVILAFETGMY